MTRCVHNIESKYKDLDDEKEQRKRSTEIDTTQRPSRFNQASPEPTFRPNELADVRRHEERSLEAIKQSQLIIERHKARRSAAESPPRPNKKTPPQPLSLTHVTERDMRKVEQEVDRLLDDRYMEPSEHPREAREGRSNLRELSKDSRRDYSLEARKIIDDQNRIADLLASKMSQREGRNEERPPLSPRQVQNRTSF